MDRPGKRELRVCFVSVNAIRILLGKSSGFGGAELDLLNIARFLAETPGVASTLVTVSEEVQGRMVDRGLAVVPVRPVPPSIGRYGRVRRAALVLSYFGRLARALWSADTDVYFCKLASDEAILTFLVARLRRRPYVFRLSHDWETDRSAIRNQIFSGSTLRTRLFLAALQRADLVFTQTLPQQAALERNLGVPSQLLPNAHQLPALEVPVLPVTRDVVLWVARGHSMKRPQLFVDLAKQLPELPFLMIMPTGAESKQLAERIAASAAGVPNMRLVPGLPPEELPAAYCRARAFVLTSEAEGFSNTIIEALKWGTPVLSLDLNFDGLFPRFVPEEDVRREPGAADRMPPPAPGYWLAGSLPALSQLIRLLAADDRFFVECSEQARRLAESRFDIRTVGPAYVSALRRLTRQCE